MTPWPYPRFVAHRGGGKLAPENTLAAMRAGFAHGYRMVEFDVKLSGDGVAFLLHDDTLDRTTNGHGPADAMNWTELAQLDAGSWHSPEYAGESLPTLSAIAHWAIANGVACNIEIKPMPGREHETGIAVALEASELWRGAVVAPLLSSFAEESLRAARDAVPALQRAWLVEEIPADWQVRLAQLDCVAFDACYKVLDADIVGAVRRAGYKVLTWTANDPASVKGLMAWGVDGIITDAIDRIAPR
jgi:glycerophosphoryl diester phosphodiesterase